MPEFPNVLVVGMHFRGGDAVRTAAELPIGTVLRLEREQDNKYDFNAIKVWYEDMFLGYIEGVNACWIAPHIDAGAPHEAVVTDKQQKGKNTHPVVTVQPTEDSYPENWTADDMGG